MKYMILMYADESIVPNYTPEQHKAAGQQWYAFNNEAKDAGVLLDNNGLASSSDATTLKVRDGKTVTTDGPFAETHEQLAGYYILNCKDLDEVMTWVAKIPIADYGTVEIRPLNQYSQ